MTEEILFGQQMQETGFGEAFIRLYGGWGESRIEV
jgi:hypothetical protein